MVSDPVEMNVVVEVSAKSEDSLDSDSTSVIVSIDEFNKTVGVSSEESAHESAAEPPTSYEPQDVLKEFCVTSAGGAGPVVALIGAKKSLISRCTGAAFFSSVTKIL